MRGFTYLEDQSWIDHEMTRGEELPISLTQAKRVTEWLKRNYGPKIEAVTKGQPFPPHIICALTCQETAYFWLKMADTLSADDVLARCVLDASGETASDPRTAFPRNTGAFKAKFGEAFTEMLIEEANKTRKIRGMGPKEWVYKGYGIFQYDLQSIEDDREFFEARQWYGIDACLTRVMQELKQKWARTHDLWASVKAYNGSGPRADQYRRNVQRFADVTEHVWSTAPGPDPAPVIVVPTPAPTVPAAATAAATEAPQAALPTVSSPAAPSPAAPAPAPAAPAAEVAAAQPAVATAVPSPTPPPSVAAPPIAGPAPAAAASTKPQDETPSV